MATDWADPLLVLCGFAAVLSLVVAARFIAALRRIAWPTPPSPGSSPGAKITVVIPARNEAQDLDAAVRSVLAQEGVELEVIVINDHSTDRTGAIADELARSDPRLTVIHDPELPPGWFGKCNAMQQAAERASGEYVLFTDADIRHGPTCFATALAELERGGYDFLSLFPRFVTVTVWENVLLPAFLGGFAQLATPGILDDKAPDALAAGAFMLVRPAAFRAVGGFAPIRDAIFDDVGLARLLKANGYRVRFLAAPALMEVRLFKDNRHAFWGMTKNVLGGLGGRLWLAPAAMVIPFLVFWTPILCAVVGITTGDPRLVAAGAVTYAIQYAMLWSGRSLFRFHPGKALLFPLVAFSIAACLGRALSLYIFRGGVHWRGRVLPIRRGESAGIAPMTRRPG